MRHINIPIFIPHLGCPNQCIFCNQRFISGTYEFDEKQVDLIIEEVLSTALPDDECEIAFFGGSFTGIDRGLMIRLLDKAQSYVDKGRAIGIRMSTRPDYINNEIISILKKYTVSCVELGIQSMNDKVLAYLKRGHTSNDTRFATELLSASKIPFCGQMMIGLPTSTADDEIACAKEICALGAVGARIYPTLVFKNTELEEITKNNQYCPLSIDEAVKRSASVYRIFLENNVFCYRIGLCESDNLHSDSSFYKGPNNASIGEMVRSRVFFDYITEKIENAGLNNADSIEIYCPRGKISQVVGNKKANITELKNRFGYKSIKVYENDSLEGFEINIKEKEGSCAIKIT